MTISRHQREAEALAARLRSKTAAGSKRAASAISKAARSMSRRGRASKNAGSWKAKAKSLASIVKSHKGGRAGDGYASKATGAEFIDSNMLGRNSKERDLEWDLDQARHPNVKHLICHASISLAGGKKLNRHEWRNYVRDWLREIGAEGVNYVAIRHTNSNHDHVHIIFSRALPNGKLLSTSHNYYRWMEALRRAEEMNGLKPIKIEQSSERLTAQSDTQVSAQRRAIRRGKTPNHINPETINHCLSKSTDMNSFATQLKSKGIELKLSKRDNGETRGILFRHHDADEFLAGSSLSRQLTLPRIQAALLANKELANRRAYVHAQQIQTQQRAAEQLARANQTNHPRERG